MKNLGFGLMRLPLLKEDDQTAVDFAQLNRMVDTFLERGFTYFDTAYMYHQGKSQIALRECLVKRHPRERFTVATKMPTMLLKSRVDHERIFEEQRRDCGVEYFDFYLLHNLNVNNYAIAEKLETFEYVRQKQKEGKVKKMGFSFHDKADLLDEILTQHPETEFVQLQLNYLDWENESIQSRKCYEVAQRHNVPMIAMEPVKGGTLAKLPEEAEALLREHRPSASFASWAVRYVAGLEGVFMVLSGMSDYAQLDDNTAYMQNFESLNAREHELIAQTVNILNRSVTVPCTACQYCVEGCPQHIPIPQYFALYNNVKQSKKAAFYIQQLYYVNYSKGVGKASDCIACGACEESCPQHIAIIKNLKDVATVFES
ncbi:MAG: 4Fe-4S dicluster domain-containing protein [Spirochaetales bacterium]|nr:4Fe-4S dicluster domain-containing protein [Spirochaetales bacterium]